MKKHLLAICCMLVTATLFANQPRVILYPNGAKHFEYEVENDLLTGTFTSYFENGKTRMQGSFIHNQKVGVWSTWDQNGTIRSKRKYTDDYRFEIIAEWDAKGNAVAQLVITQKNERLAGLQTAYDPKYPIIYTQRFWKSIGADNSSNAFVFKDNFFFNYLLDQLAAKTLPIFSNERFVHPIEKFESAVYKQAVVVEYLIKTDISYSNEPGVMHNRLIGICPVIIENGLKKQLGWFYIPDIRQNPNANETIKTICSNLEKNNYAGTIIKTTLNAGSREEREVPPADTDALNLSVLDFEAGALVYYMDKSFTAK